MTITKKKKRSNFPCRSHDRNALHDPCRSCQRLRRIMTQPLPIPQPPILPLPMLSSSQASPPMPVLPSVSRPVLKHVGMGLAVAKSAEGISRQPEAESKIRTTLMLGLVFIETAIIYALLVVILIIFVL